MSALTVSSTPRVFKINNEDRFFRTLTTHQNGEIQKTVYQQTIDKDTYDQGVKDNPTLVSEKDGLYYATVRVEGESSSYTTYADDAFKVEWAKTGNNSIESYLNTDSIKALAQNTDQTEKYWREEGGYSQFRNTGQAIADSINFSSENVPLEITTNKRRTAYENLFYPEDIVSSKQDRIRFGMRYISGKRDISFNLSNINPLSVSNRQTESIQGSVTLPIPGGISDQNKVKFDGDTMTLGMAAAAGAILNPGGAASAVGQLLNDALTKSPEELQSILTSPDASNIVSALRMGLAQQFTGGNLVSRLGGGILNPNMELLFQAPELRQFGFKFTMSARSSTEAAMIKKIIRFFKQGMSVKKTNNNVFVISPNIFTIAYKTGDGRNHPSIGRIKNCALTQLNTTYGDQTYMTYDDPDRTLTQYSIDMTFMELDPITEDDYLDADYDSSGVSNMMLAPELDEFITLQEFATDSSIGY